MRSHVLAFMAALGLLVSSPAPLLAQGASPDPAVTAPKRSRATGTRPKREPTVGQLAARERIRTCGAEWREAKGKGTTGGLKWPQYYSRCNARLKGGQA